MTRQKKISSVAVFVALILIASQTFAAETTMFFPPEWSGKGEQVKAITDALSQKTGMDIRPRIATSYPELLQAFTENRPVITYAGSFVQAILYARKLSVPIVQGVNGMEFYTSIMIVSDKSVGDPVAIVKEAASEVAFATAASSGESGAKAATGGKSALGTGNHQASVNAVKAGKAKVAFVKNWWWEANKGKNEGFKSMEYPGVSDHKNPDNILSANKAVAQEDLSKIKTSIREMSEVFGVKSFSDVQPAVLDPSLDLMKKGGIDPKTYSW